MDVGFNETEAASPKNFDQLDEVMGSERDEQEVQDMGDIQDDDDLAAEIENSLDALDNMGEEEVEGEEVFEEESDDDDDDDESEGESEGDDEGNSK
jgi:hypothetical protein